MIQFVKRKNLDLPKYEACVAKALDSRIYAQPWYLDAVCSTWAVLVQDDYVAVMPLPIKRKYGFPYVYLAPWIQQLGIFSREQISPDLFNLFIRAIPSRFKFVELMLNPSNPLTMRYSTGRTNFILPLHTPYETLYKGYSKGRKSSIKQAEKANLVVDWSSSVTALIALFKQGVGRRVSFKKEAYGRLEKLVVEAEKRNLLSVLGVKNSHGALLGGALFLKDHNRWVYLFSSQSETGRNLQAMSFLLDTFIKKHAQTDGILDFEGSMIPGIASFFKSFGAISETYGHYKRYLWY
ncbi:hypothetical protein MWU59_04085 [Flavobacteriaceae bacterium F08102]|nr:hypothetical protein [Flavobacteriaceae bacterium F08102]